MLFESEYPNVHGVFVQPVWAAGDLLEFAPASLTPSTEAASARGLETETAL